MGKKEGDILGLLVEGQKLMNSVDDLLNNKDQESKSNPITIKKDNQNLGQDKIIQIKVIERGKIRFDIRLPLNLADLWRRFIPGKMIEQLREEYDIDFEQLLVTIKQDMESRKLFDIYDQKSETKLEISVL